MESECYLTRAALGQIASIGSIYDSRTDNFIGATIFKKGIPPSALTLTNNHSCDVKYINSDTFSEKFTKLDVSPELQVSILGGLISLLDGPGKYLKEEKKSLKSVQLSLLYNICTKEENVNIYNEELKDCFNLDAMEYGTHVLVGITWGSNSLINCTYKMLQKETRHDIEGILLANLKKIAFCISGKGEVDVQEGDKEKEKIIEIQIFSDILPHYEELPQNYESTIKFIKKIPKLLESTKEGKGKPVKYTLISIKEIMKCFKFSLKTVLTLYQINESSLIRIVNIFEDISTARQMLYDQLDLMEKFNFCISSDELGIIRKLKKNFLITEADFKSKFSTTLVKVRGGESEASELESVIYQYFQNDSCSKKVQSYFSINLKEISEKISFAETFCQNNIIYIGYGLSLDSLLLKNIGLEIYVFYFKFLNKGGEVTTNWEQNRDLFFNEFFNKKLNSNCLFVAVDCDAHPELYPSVGNNIQITQNGKITCNNLLLESRLKFQNISIARCIADGLENTFFSSTNKMSYVKIHCPGNDCNPRDDHKWLCIKCEKYFEYGYDDHFYCFCGKSHMNNFEFKCSSPAHGLNFNLFTDEKHFKDVLSKLTPFKDINILILGEIGVGKSTWINGFYNYFSFENLAEAEKHLDLRALIHTQFTVLNDNYEPTTIKTGISENEVHVIGQSTTTKTKIYPFQVGDVTLRLIDTPGFGDVRGMDQDEVNLQNILSTLSQLKNIHGICVFLKPNEFKLNVMFHYCINKLLRNLQESARQNILFCFTHTRSTFYEPPQDTLKSLKKLLSEKDMEIPLSRQTIYSFDSESFRFLAILKNNPGTQITFNENDQKNFEGSWEKSKYETQRLFEHIQSLKSFSISSTLNTNEMKKDQKLAFEKNKKNDNEFEKDLYLNKVDLNIPGICDHRLKYEETNKEYIKLNIFERRITEVIESSLKKNGNGRKGGIRLKNIHISEIAEKLSYSHSVCENWDLISVELLKSKPLDILKPISSFKTENDNFEKIYNTLVLWRKQKGGCAPLEEISEITGNYCKTTFDKLVNYSKKIKSQLELKAEISGKEFWNVPARNDEFVGRQEILEILAEKINSAEIKKSNLQIALIGPRGFGKRSIALEMIYRNLNEFSHIFWFESSIKLKKQFWDLSKKLNYGNSAIEKSEEKIILNMWFEKNFNWLIVFNNIDGFQEIEEFFPKVGGTIIILSSKENNENWPNFIQQPVGLLSIGESFNLINKILKLKTPDFEEFEILSKNCEYCPFQLVQSCHYIKNWSNDISKYVQIYNKYLKEDQISLNNLKSTGVELSNFLVCKITMDKIKEINPLAYEWLQICSFSSPQKIPKIFLKEFLKFRKQPEIDVSIFEKLLLQYNLINMFKKGFKTYYSIHPIVHDSLKIFIEKEFDILKICHQIILSSIDQSDDKKDMLYYATEFLLYLMSKVNLMCSAVNVKIDDENMENHIILLKEFNEIISSLIDCLFKLNEDECIEILYQFYFDEKEIFIMNGLDHEYKISLNLAQSFYEKGHQNLEKIYFLKLSLMFYKRNLSIAEKLKEYDAQDGYIFGRIGTIYFDLKDFSNSQIFLEKSLKIMKENNQDPLSQIDLKIKMGQIYEKIDISHDDSLKKISEVFESAIRLYLNIFQDFILENQFEKNLSSDMDNSDFDLRLDLFENTHDEKYKKVHNLYFSLVCENYGSILLSKGKISESRKYFEMAAERLKEFDSDFLSQIRVNYFLAMCELKDSNFYKSYGLFKNAIHIIEKISKPDFVHKVGDLSEINNFFESYEILNFNHYYNERMKMVYKEHFSGLKYNFLYSANANMIIKLVCQNLDYSFNSKFSWFLVDNLDKFYKCQLSYYYRNLLDIVFNLFKYKDPKRALECINSAMNKEMANAFEFNTSTLNLLKSVCLFELGQYEESKCEIEKVLKFCEKNNLHFHFRNGQAFYELGRIFLKKGDFYTALENFRKSIVIFNQCCSTENNLYSAIVQKSIGSCYYAIEKKFDAYILFKKSFQIQDQVKYHESIKKAETSHCLASCYFDMRDYNKAIIYYEKALAIFDNIFWQDNIKIKSFYTREFLGRCFYHLSNYGKSLELLKSALEVYEKKSDSIIIEINLSSTLFYISYILDKIGNDEKSKLYFQKAVDYKKSKKLNVQELLKEIEIISNSLAK